MLGMRFQRNFVILFVAIIFDLLSASIVVAQTPTVTLDKPAVESSSPLPEPAPKTPATPAPANAAAPDPAPAPPPAAAMQQCPANTRMIKADVVAIPKAIMLNRLGATIPNAFVFALRGDTIGTGNNIQLRPGKRPRPIVLRANVGDCLRIIFTNAIPPASFAQSTPQSPGVGTTEVSLHIQGQEWASGSSDDGSFVGRNSSSLATTSPPPATPPMPPQTQTYTLFVKNEGTFLMYTMGDTEAVPTGQLSAACLAR